MLKQKYFQSIFCVSFMDRRQADALPPQTQPRLAFLCLPLTHLGQERTCMLAAHSMQRAAPCVMLTMIIAVCSTQLAPGAFLCVHSYTGSTSHSNSPSSLFLSFLPFPHVSSKSLLDISKGDSVARLCRHGNWQFSSDSK